MRFNITKNMISNELMNSTRRFLNCYKNGFSIHLKTCNICYQNFDLSFLNDNDKNQNQNSVFIYSCGHWEHKFCIDKVFSNCSNYTNNYCSKCYPYLLNQISNFNIKTDSFININNSNVNNLNFNNKQNQTYNQFVKQNNLFSQNNKNV